MPSDFHMPSQTTALKSYPSSLIALTTTAVAGFDYTTQAVQGKWICTGGCRLHRGVWLKKLAF